MIPHSKKGQVNTALITSLVFGIASLVIGVIIAFVIVSTLTDANLLEAGRDSITVVNESGFINSTGYPLAGSALNRYLSGSITIVTAINGTDGVVLTSTNYTTSTAGTITNASEESYLATNITYTYTLKTSEEVSTDGMVANFTAGVDNVSGKLPTVLLVAAIVLILGVLVLLVATWQRMRIGGGGI